MYIEQVGIRNGYQQLRTSTILMIIYEMVTKISVLGVEIVND